MAKEPAETDRSVPFEIANFPTEYCGYYATKRLNMLAMVQKNRAMWDYFHMIDQIIFREIDDLQVSTEFNTQNYREFR